MNKLEIQMKDSLHSKQILDCTSVGTHQLNQLKHKRLPLISIYCKFKEIQAGVVTILAENNQCWTCINRNG